MQQDVSESKARYRLTTYRTYMKSLENQLGSGFDNNKKLGVGSNFNAGGNLMTG